MAVYDTGSARIIKLESATHTFAVCFAGYDRKRRCDDLVYIAVNTYWENVTFTLPNLHSHGQWRLHVNTYGDGAGRYFYEDQDAVRINGSFVMRPRSVAVFVYWPR